MQEFIERTGFAPTKDCYEQFIEPKYMNSNLGKNDWCKDWKKYDGIEEAYIWQVTHDEAERKSLLLKVQEKEKIIGMLQSDLEKVDKRNQMMAFFLIDQSEKYSSTELREKAIEMIGEKSYLTYKINLGMNIWELDRELLIKYLQ